MVRFFNVKIQRMIDHKLGGTMENGDDLTTTASTITVTILTTITLSITTIKAEGQRINF